MFFLKEKVNWRKEILLEKEFHNSYKKNVGNQSVFVVFVDLRCNQGRPH